MNTTVKPVFNEVVAKVCLTRNFHFILLIFKRKTHDKQFKPKLKSLIIDIIKNQYIISKTQQKKILRC